MRVVNIVIGLLLLLPTLGKSQSANNSDFNNQFAFDFFKQVSAKEKGNIFFSPISLSTAMGMAYAGANGETQTQIAKVFHFSANNKKFNTQQGKILKQISSNTDSIQLRFVNTLWADKTYPLKKSYNKTLKSAYSASAEQVDFINKYEESRMLINRNISKSTFEKVNDLLPSGSLNNLTRFVLANAVYFKADWKIQFQKERTVDANFFVTPQNPIRCMMMGIKSKFNYFEDEKLQALELPYSSNNFSMLFILPRQDLSLDVLLNDITQDYLNSIISGLAKQEITITIPKYKLSKGYQLKQVLSNMGMPQPFSDNADFSRMTTRNDLKISDVFHKAFIEVNEQGTEAAASTAVVIAMKSIGNDKIFKANRPFIFLIIEKTSDSILFMGRMVDPSKSE